VVGLVLVAAVAALAAWNTQRQSDKTAEAPANTAERPPPSPSANAAVADEPQPQTGAALRERPPRERVDRPGDANDEQLRKQAAQEFRGADADGDGFLSRDEAARFPYVSKEFQRVDADGDGRISLQEFVRLRRFQAR